MDEMMMYATALVVAAILVVMWMPKRKASSIDSGGGGQTIEMKPFALIAGAAILLVVGFLVVGIAAAAVVLAAGGAWVAYRYFAGGGAAGEMVTHKYADRIVREFKFHGVPLDGSRSNIFGVEVPAAHLHLIEFKQEAKVFTINQAGQISGPRCCTLMEAVEEVYAKRELFMPAAVVKVREPQVAPLNKENEDNTA